MTSSVELLRTVCALAFVIGLIWLFGHLIRKYGWKWGMPVSPMTKAQRRLQIVESLSLDAKNRLMIIKRDNVEHLIIMNSENTQIIETSIEGTPS